MALHEMQRMVLYSSNMVQEFIIQHISNSKFVAGIGTIAVRLVPTTVLTTGIVSTAA